MQTYGKRTLQGISVGNLTIAAYPSVATTWLPEIVRTFQRDYPEVQFNIMEGIRSEIFGHLNDHVADMGFLAYAEPMDYEWTPLAEEAVIAVVPEDHRLGVSFVNELSAQYWNDHLVKLPLDPPQKVEFGIAYTSKEHMTAAAKKFYDYAIRCIRGE